MVVMPMVELEDLDAEEPRTDLNEAVLLRVSLPQKLTPWTTRLR